MARHFEAETLDDLMRQAMQAVIETDRLVQPTKGATLELTACMLELTNPRSRLSLSQTRGHVFSPPGELCWYLSGRDDVEFIKYYIKRYEDFAERDGHVRGAYGKRLMNFGGVNQIERVIDQLKTGPATRKAVVQIFDRSDVEAVYKDVPCTSSLQFLQRDGKLELITFMRSNDLYMGFPHDVFAFTMLQELVARSLGIEVGVYTHMVGSLHLYASDLQGVKDYMAEGWQSSVPAMPAMPLGDPWGSVATLIRNEEVLRLGQDVTVSQIHAYWADLELLLAAFARRHDREALLSLRPRLAHSAYWPYIREKIDRTDTWE